MGESAFHTILSSHKEESFVPLDIFNFWTRKAVSEKVYLRSQILTCPSIGEYCNICGVSVLPENLIVTFFRTN